MVEDHADDEFLDGEDEIIEPPPIPRLLEASVIHEEEGYTSSSSYEEDGEDDEIPAPRVRSEEHGMSLRTRLPPLVVTGTPMNSNSSTCNTPT